MNKLFLNIFLFLSTLLLLQACSIVGQHSIYNSSVGAQDKNRSRNVFNNLDYQKVNTTQDASKPKRIPQGFNILAFESVDSSFFGIEEFHGGKMLFFGPAYIPIIPNVFYPLFYIGNKDVAYHILISFTQFDTLYVDSLRFYRNQKEIFSDFIKELEFNDSTLKGMYTIVSVHENDMQGFGIYPRKYYLFTFKLKKFTMKEIEIKYRGNQLFKVKRRKKIYYEPFIFAS